MGKSLFGKYYNNNFFRQELSIDVKINNQKHDWEKSIYVISKLLPKKYF